MITKDTIQNILETARVEDVIGEFITLKKRGVNMIGLCPFHDEKTPSFTVSPVKGIYKCFGCGKSGNAVNFIMEHEHYTYPEALRFLAKKYGIPIEEEEKTPEQEQAADERESLYAVNTLAQEFFTDKLFNSETGKAIALSYLVERGFNEAIIEKFHLGFSPDAWDAFTQYALEKGYKKEYLVKTGLTVAKENKQYDRFRARVIFPIHNLTGRVVGFGGRILTKDKKKPKYVNSPESEIYNKSKILYGLFFSKKKIISEDNCYLVEGYTDVISLHQAGIENVVASSGTSLTTEQIKLIRRYTKNITILFDGDEAGLKASFRGIDMILAEGMHVKVVLFPEGEDPDSYAREKRPAEVKEFIKQNAKDFIAFKTGLLLKEAQGDPIKKAELIKEIVKTISEIPDVVDRTVYIQECSQLMDINERSLNSELNKLLRKKFKKKEKATTGEQEEAKKQTETQLFLEEAGTEPHEKEIVRMLLMYASREIIFKALNEDERPVDVPVRVAEFIVNEIVNDDIQFSNENYAKIFKEYKDAIEKEEYLPDEQYFFQHEDENIKNITIDVTTSPYSLSENWEEKKIYVVTEDMQLKSATVNLINAFKLRKVETLLEDLSAKIKNPSEEDDMQEIITRYRDLSALKKDISGKLKRIIIK